MSSSFAETFPHCRNSGEWVGRRRRSRSRSAPIIHRKRCERGEENAVGKSDTSMLTKIILFFALICVQNIIWRYNSTDMHCFLSRKSCLTRMKDGEDHRKNVQPNLAVYPKSSRNSWQLLECLMAWEQNSGSGNNGLPLSLAGIIVGSIPPSRVMLAECVNGI